MRSSGLLKWLMIPVAVLVVWLGIRLFSSDDPAAADPGAKHAPDTHLSQEEMKALGVDGDSPRDTVATLVAQVRQLRQELKSAVDDNQAQRALSEQLKQRESSLDQRIQSALAAERERWKSEDTRAAEEERKSQGILEDLQRRLEGVGKRDPSTELPIGLGLEDATESPLESEPRWIEPQGTGRPSAEKTSRRSTSRRAATATDPALAAASAGSEELTAVTEAVESASDSLTKSFTAKPVFTVPQNATLIGSVAMTSLIGRIPVDGTVNDPYPFKVIIGSDNLTANGIDLPDLVGAVASGTASGDWTLSCVRGRIRSLTFVFRDGTIRTVSSESSRRTSDAMADITEGLGWISDPYGIPCVTGARVSNAQQYLGTQALITAAGAGAASLIDTQSNFSVMSGANGALGTVGITGNEAMGRILGAGVQEMSQWVNKLYGQAFAAVYVKPMAQVAVHIEEALEIDYDSRGRKVRHSGEASDAATLD